MTQYKPLDKGNYAGKIADYFNLFEANNYAPEHRKEALRKLKQWAFRDGNLAEIQRAYEMMVNQNGLGYNGNVSNSMVEHAHKKMHGKFKKFYKSIVAGSLAIPLLFNVANGSECNLECNVKKDTAQTSVEENAYNPLKIPLPKKSNFKDRYTAIEETPEGTGIFVYDGYSVNDSNKGKIDEKILDRFIKRVYYHKLMFEHESKYGKLRKLIEKYSGKKYEECKTIFYLAAPPHYFGAIANNLAKAHLVNKRDKSMPTRIVFEKPFGNDLKSAAELNSLITKVFDEKQIYRIDHYLAKELVQTIMVLRFSNTIFQHLWNSQHIDHVQITAAETLGVENRALYYDKSGALKDIMQNHMMQLLALVAMEAPTGISAEGIRNAKIQLLKSASIKNGENAEKTFVMGQYTSGTINGKHCAGYREEEGVGKNSDTETYAALKLFIDNQRWKNVPVYLRAGKRLKEQSAEIAVVFKSLPDVLFTKNNNSEPNALIIRVQPYEGISLEFNSKVPGTNIAIEPVSMDFCHECKFGPNSPEAYERLLYDVIEGDQTLFTGWEEVEQSWRIMEPILNAWKNGKNLEEYQAGTWGPKSADVLIKADSRKWIAPKKPLYSEWIGK